MKACRSFEQEHIKLEPGDLWASSLHLSGDRKSINAEVYKSFSHLRKSYSAAERPAESSLGGSDISTVSNRGSFTGLDSQPIWRMHACVSSRCCASLPHTKKTLLGKNVNISITARKRQARHRLT